MKSLSRVQLLATPWTAAYQVPPSVGFSRQEYWSGVSLPSPGVGCGRAQTSASAWRAASGTPRKQIKAHVTGSNGTPLQYSCLENPTDGGAWWAAVHGVAKSRRDFTFTFHFHALEKEMATHSSVLAWRIPGAAEPGGLPSMGSHRVGHD